MLSKTLKKRFCTDNKLPIKLFDEPYFTQRIQLLGVEDKFKEFEDLIDNRFFGSEQDYLEYYNKLKDLIIDYIKASSAFQSLNASDKGKSFECTNNFSQSDVYKVPNVGHKFISIDMSKANFSALVYYAKHEGLDFFDSYDWDAFMSKFTDIDLLKQSKYIRQVVFGNCNPKRQVKFEKFLMDRLVSSLLDLDIISKDDIYSLCSDEIIIKADNLSNDVIATLEGFVSQWVDYNIPLKITKFRLGRIDGTTAYFKYSWDSNDVLGIKCLSPDDMTFVYTKLRGLDLQDDDLVFEYNGHLSKYMEVPEVRFDYGF